MQKISILTWNLNSRTNDLTIEGQIELLKNYMPDIITLQEITINSLKKIRLKLIGVGYKNIVSSFDICNDISLLSGKRKYGQIILWEFSK